MAGGRFGQDGVSLFRNITTNTTTTVKTGAGVLRRVIVNKAGATGNTATVNVDGVSIGVIDTTVVGGRGLDYNVPFSASLSVVTATGTAGDVTVLYN